jgi:hypothetical protein
MDNLTPEGIAREIRLKVQDINDLVLLAALAEVDIEFMPTALENAPRTQTLSVYISQAV